MRVLVFEPKFVGHFIGFALASCRAYVEAGCEVTLALSRDARGSDAAAVKLLDIPHGLQVEYSLDVPKVYQKWTNGRLETAALESALRRRQPDWLVAPSADFLTAGLLFKRSLRRRLARLRGADFVLHNCRQAYPHPALRERPAHWLDRLSLNLLPGVQLHTVDEYALSMDAAYRVSMFGRPVKYLPHFFDRPGEPHDSDSARDLLGLRRDGWWIGSAGDLGRRKGTELLIESFAAAARSTNAYLALFGCLSETSRETLARHQSLVEAGRIVIRDRFISEQEFAAFFPAMDAVWVGYPRQVGMASTLLFAADASKPVIAIDYGGVGWTVRMYNLGVVCQANRDAVVSQIRSLSLQTPTAVSEEDAKRFLQKNSTENFNRALTAGVRASCATPAPLTTGAQA